MDRVSLQTALAAAQSRVAADPERTLSTTGLPSGLAFLALALLEPLAAHDDQDEVADLLGELVGKQHRKTLRRVLAADVRAALRAIDRDELLRDACQSLIESLSQTPATREALQIQMRLDVSHEATAQNVRQTVVQAGGHYHEAPPDHETARQSLALLNYLRALRTECRPLQLDLIDTTDAADVPIMRLEQVYISLNTESRVKLTEEERQAKMARDRSTGREEDTRLLSALEALTPAARLTLLGAPGSGKSTFVNHLVLCLAGARLCAQRADELQPSEGWLACVPGWTLGALLPVRVVLRDFAAFSPLAAAPKGSLDLLLQYLTSRLGTHAEAIAPIVAALAEGQGILLFDGLDEVVGDAILSRVVESISAAAGTYTASPVLVTCRTLDYQSNPRRHLRDFRVETLAVLDDDQVDTFVDAWYGERAATGRQVLGTAEGLRTAIRARQELRNLARLPLLLTMMAVVHAGKGALPDARALLYAECVDLLLLRWRQRRGESDLLEQIGLREFRANDLLGLMARLGYIAHLQSARDPFDVNRPADLTNAQVRQELGVGFAPYTAGNPERREELVTIVIHRIATRNGLLLKHSGEHEEVYAFPHRSFQEFLAGYHLSSRPDYDRLCLEHAGRIHWHEALRLMVSYQVLKNNDLRLPPALARDLLDRGPLEQSLAGELLNLVGRERAGGYRPDFLAPGGLWPRAQQALLNVAITGAAPSAPATLRARAGLAAGTLCYGGLSELCVTPATIPFADRRLPLAVLGTAAQQEPWWPDALAAYWCAIEAGLFWYGDDTQKDARLRQVTLPYAYKIARYPVTNADYARFIADNGYNPEHAWWTPQGRAFLRPGGHRYDDQEHFITLPRLWNTPGYNNPLQPVVGISWYEAAAYCKWLTAQGHQQGWLRATDEIRLPTSLEWERAARHIDQRRYPWSDAEPTPEHANHDKTGIGAPSPVGCFPQDVAECGALDMAGNVMEWLATPYDKPKLDEPRKDFTRFEFILLSYGSFVWKSECMFCGARNGYYPDYRLNYQGLRLACSPRSSE